MSHYHQPMDWSPELLLQARRILDRFYGALNYVQGDEEAFVVEVQPHPEVLAALADDLNVPAALAHLHHLANDLHRAKQTTPTPLRYQFIKSAGLLGLAQQTPHQWFQQLDAHAPLTQIELHKRIAQRDQAKLVRDFVLADQIRTDLEAMGYVLLDGPSGTSWRIKQG